MSFAHFLLNGVPYIFDGPEMGNTAELSFQRATNTTRGGDLIIFRDADWPKTEKLTFKFDFCHEADGQRLKNFLRQSIGQFIYYRDHENKLWHGVITNPEADLVQAGRQSWQIEVQFEGDMA